MIAVGVSQREAAASLGFSHSTISKAQQRDADFAASLRRAAVQGLHSQRWRRQLASLGTSANPLGQAIRES
jgi:IS30 family transposase